MRWLSRSVSLYAPHAAQNNDVLWGIWSLPFRKNMRSLSYSTAQCSMVCLRQCLAPSICGPDFSGRQFKGFCDPARRGWTATCRVRSGEALCFR